MPNSITYTITSRNPIRPYLASLDALGYGCGSPVERASDYAQVTIGPGLESGTPDAWESPDVGAGINLGNSALTGDLTPC
jgi:hypothetical protein